MDLAPTDDDPYTIDGSWVPSYFSLQSLPSLESLPWDNGLPDLAQGVFESPLKLFQPNDSSIFELNIFGADQLELTDTSLDSVDISEAGHEDTKKPHEDDEREDPENIWTLEDTLKPKPTAPVLHSWDGFPDQCAQQQLVSGYLSEAGDRGFDAILAHQATESGLEDSGRAAQTDIFLESLFKLGLGWNSIFFQYDEMSRNFQKHMRDVRVSGISLAAVDGLVEELAQSGTNIRKIRQFVRDTQASASLSPALSGLARATFILLHALEQHLENVFSMKPTLLELQLHFRQSGIVIGTLASIVASAKDERQDSDIISSVFVECDQYASRFSWLRDVLHETMSYTAQPWLSLVETWIGLKPAYSAFFEWTESTKPPTDTESDKAGNGQTTNFPGLDSALRPELMPTFVPPEHARTILESGRSLRLLKASHPQHPIAREDVLKTTAAPGLQCVFTWEDIEAIRKRADEYESRLRAEILKYNQGHGRTNGEEAIKTDEQAAENTNESVDEIFDLFEPEDADLSTGLLDHSAKLATEKLSQIFAQSGCLGLDSNYCSESTFGPPLSASFYLSFSPILTSQARLVEFSCLHLLFKEEKVRRHVQLQWRFHLLGDGIFSSRLSHALFDADMESGERKSGVVRSGVHTGLRLGSRDTWPPASSELRLVLMGLLAECHAEGEQYQENLDINSQAKEGELPGGLSFSIRDLSGDQLEKCKNPNSIEALDFLRLQYKPPRNLEAIITTNSLQKYDRLFKHLLRLMRMTSVVRNLVRDSTHRRSRHSTTRSVSQRFRVEAQHFIQAVNDYSFQVGIGIPWQKFEATLSKIEKCIDRGDIDGAIGSAKSIHRLKDYHEDILDQILFSLFLSKRQAQVLKLLDELFTTILAFVPLSRADGLGDNKPQYDHVISHLHATFRKQVGSFVGFLRGLNGVKASRQHGKQQDMDATTGSSASNDHQNVFEYLLLKLDLKTYY